MAKFQVFDQDGNVVPITASANSSFSLVVPPGVTSLTVRDLASNTIDLGSADRTLVIDEREGTVRWEGVAGHQTPHSVV